MPELGKKGFLIYTSRICPVWLTWVVLVGPYLVCMRCCQFFGSACSSRALAASHSFMFQFVHLCLFLGLCELFILALFCISPCRLVATSSSFCMFALVESHFGGLLFKWVAVCSSLSHVSSILLAWVVTSSLLSESLPFLRFGATGSCSS